LVLLTDGVRCAACAWLIDRALMREPGVLEVSANAVTGRIRIAWDPARTPLSRPLQRLVSLGYRPWLATGAEREQARVKERNRALLRLGIAGLGAVQAMMFTEALYLDTNGSMSIPMRDFLRWIAFLVSSPVVFYSGWPFIAGCLRELREYRLGADTLIATSVLLAYGASLFETLTGGPHVWYDAAVMFVFLLLAARMLEQRARSAASARVDALARARPAFAVRERADGSREAIPLDEAARRMTAEARAENRRMPGFGHRVHHTVDPRTAVLFGMAREYGIAGKGVEFISAVEDAIREQIRPVPINIDGALAAVLFDMGFPAPFGKLVFIIGRVAGLTAEVAEEYAREKAMRVRIPVTYDGPPPREIE